MTEGTGTGTVGAEQSSEQPALAAIREAFIQFESSIYPSDARLFRSTTLKNVKDAAHIIEREQAKRRCLRNLRRIKPFFDGLARFGGSIETLCQGTPYLCFVWAPIKLLLQIADEYTSGFERLIDAYSQIAQRSPRFDRLSYAFKHQPDFQAVLADVYADILEFHLHAYKFLRRSGWKHLFDASWRNFGSKFNAILQNLSRSDELVGKEAASFEILEAKSMREKLISDLDRREAQKREWQLRDSLAWLDLQGHDREQDDLLERCSASRQEGTCEWILRHPKVLAWLDEEDSRSMLWLKGKPGAGRNSWRTQQVATDAAFVAGKTTLASYLSQTAPISPQSSMFYLLCPNRLTRPGSSVCGLTFRLLIAQLIRARADTLPFVYETLVKLGVTPSLSKVRELLGTLLRSPGTTYIILDGLDECESADQKQMLSEIQNLLRPNARAEMERLKILICSRETKEISRRLNKTPNIFLSDEQQQMSRDIAIFTNAGLAELEDRFDPRLISEISAEVVKKADGMFLWVRLVLSMLLDQESISDLRAAAQHLPEGLAGAYENILRRIRTPVDESQRLKVEMILSWLTFAYRSLRSWELCDALVFSSGNNTVNDQTKLGKGILNICKPLIEEREGDIVTLVHFSAREYLLSQHSGPFLSPLKSQADISWACLRCLAACHVFLADPATLKAREQIVKGYHDLYSYVHEFWMRHLLAWMGLQETVLQTSSPPPLIKQVSTILGLFSRPQAPLSSCQETSIEASIPTDISAPASPSKGIYQSLPTLLQQYLQFRENAAAHCKIPSLPRSDSDDDPTLFSSSFKCYRAAFEQLLSVPANQECAKLGLDPTDLKRFQDLHGRFGYLCSFPKCRRGFIGYPSESDRDKHEAFHSPQFRCSEMDCDFSQNGFNSQQALRRHQLRYHTSAVDLPLPAFGARRAAERRQMSLEDNKPINWIAQQLAVSQEENEAIYRPPQQVSKPQEDNEVNNRHRALTAQQVAMQQLIKWGMQQQLVMPKLAMSQAGNEAINTAQPLAMSMSPEDRQKLQRNLQNMPPEQLQIMKARDVDPITADSYGSPRIDVTPVQHAQQACRSRRRRFSSP